MSVKRKWMILRGSVIALTVLAFAGALVHRMWLIGVAGVLLIPWIWLLLRWWRCPKCGQFLGPLEDKPVCSHCGQKFQ